MSMIGNYKCVRQALSIIYRAHGTWNPTILSYQ